MKIREHELKIYPDQFQPMLDGDKSFDVRLNDRNFQRGDRIHYREYDPNLPEQVLSDRYTGREGWYTITMIQSWGGLGPGYIAMGLTPYRPHGLKELTIIDADIKTYEGFVEEETRLLRNSDITLESWFQARRRACTAVVEAMRAYREAMRPGALAG